MAQRWTMKMDASISVYTQTVGPEFVIIKAISSAGKRLSNLASTSFMARSI
jgi:hypothetical protein